VAGRKLPPVDFRPRSPLASRARSVRTRPPGRDRKEFSFTRVILPSSVLSRCSSQHAARFAVERGWLPRFHSAMSTERARHEQMSARLRPLGNSLPARLFRQWLLPTRMAPVGTGARSFRENLRSFRGLASCDIAPVRQCARRSNLLRRNKRPLYSLRRMSESRRTRLDHRAAAAADLTTSAIPRASASACRTAGKRAMRH
jgi:hypothetical protein